MGVRRSRSSSATAASSTRSTSQDDKATCARLSAPLALRRPSVIPGFGLTLGFTADLSGADRADAARGLVLQDGEPRLGGVLGARLRPRARWPRCELSFGARRWPRPINAVFGLLVAWVLVRYRFPGRRLLDALIDLPFALPTAVAGIALTALYAPNGWIGRCLHAARHQGRLYAARRCGRADLHRPAVRRAHGAAGAGRLDREVEEAAATLGARRLQTFSASCFPPLLPALLTGFALALRAGSANTAR